MYIFTISNFSNSHKDQSKFQLSCLMHRYAEINLI